MPLFTFADGWVAIVNWLAEPALTLIPVEVMLVREPEVNNKVAEPAVPVSFKLVKVATPLIAVAVREPVRTIPVAEPMEIVTTEELSAITTFSPVSRRLITG